jgi:hypothetical protein
MPTNRATSANIARALRAHGHDVIPARDISRRLEDGLRVSSAAGVVEVRIKNFRGTLHMDNVVVNVKRDLVFAGYDVQIGHNGISENQTVLYVRNEGTSS